MNNKLKLVAALIFAAMLAVFAQTPVTTALKLPRLSTTERDAMPAVSGNTYAKGLMIFNTDNNKVEYWDGASWIADTDGVVGNEVVDAANATLTRTGAGSAADPYKLKANISVIVDSLLSNETFVKNFSDTLFNKTNAVDTIFSKITGDNAFLQSLIDSLLSKTNAVDTIFNTITYDDSKLQTLIDSLLKKTNIGDTIMHYITENFSTELGDAMVDYITENVTQKLTDSIMANVTVTSTNGMVILGSGKSAITVNLPAASANNEVLTWDSGTSKWIAKSIGSITTSGTVTSVTSNVTALTFGANTTTTPVLAVNGGSAGQFLAVDGTWKTPANDNTFPTFTSTTGLVFTGAGTATQTVNLPAGGTNTTFLRGDGSWATPANTVYTGTAPITVSGTTISLDDLGVTTAKLADGAVTTVKIAADAVDSTKIKNGSISLADLKNGAVAGQIMQWDGSKWVLTTAASVIKKLNVAVATGGAQTVGSVSFTGATSTGANVELIGIEPVIDADEDFIADFLTVSATAKVVGNAIKYVVKIQNSNVDNGNGFTVTGINIYYLSDSAVTSAAAPAARTYTGW